VRVRETKYPNAKAVLAAVEWQGGWHQAYRDGKLLPKDMPDLKSELLAEGVEYYMTLAEDRWNKLKEYLESVPDEQG
jgi:hypothetical protein